MAQNLLTSNKVDAFSLHWHDAAGFWDLNIFLSLKAAVLQNILKNH